MVFNVDYLLRGTTAYVSAGAHGIGEGDRRSARPGRRRVFLASPLSRFITGAALDIGGTIRGLI
jgi:hypothetical protein